MRSVVQGGLMITLAAVVSGISMGCATGGSSGGDEQTVVVNRVQNLSVDEQSPVQTTGINPGDIEPIAQRMVRSILSNQRVMNAVPAPAGPVQVRPVPRITLRPIRNATSERLDPQIITARIRNELIRNSEGRIDFVYRDIGEDASTIDKAVEYEEQLRRQGVVDGGTGRQQSSADLFLQGEIREHVNVTPDGRDRLMILSFYIFDTDRSIMIWADDYPVRRASLLSVNYRGVDK